MDISTNDDDTMATDDRAAIIDASRKKRRHPESSSSSTSITATNNTLSNNKSSLEVLQLVEHPNFEELARWNPMFQRAWNATRQTQKETQKTFSACVSQEFTIALTRALLKTHLDLELPYLEEGHLCPPVPNRFFYLHWIHTELLRVQQPPRMTSAEMGQQQQQKQQQEGGRLLFGMDIGAGATGIYSLLAAKFFQCYMFTSEIDESAAAMAQHNAEANHLTSRIHVAHIMPSHSQDPNLGPGGPLERSLVALGQFMMQQQQQQQPPSTRRTLDFVMTNPPFYDPSTMEHVNPRAGDGRARTAMTVSEGSYPEGEIGFVTDMIADSLRRRHSSRWFSSMLGKKTSLVHLQKMLTHVLGPTHIRLTEYGPGQYTRWFLAWTLERPTATDPNARVPFHESSDRFTVSLSTLLANNNNVTNPSHAVSEVISRIIAYCESSPGGWNLTAAPLQTAPPIKHRGGDNIIPLTANSTSWLQIQETNPLPISLFVDEADPTVDQKSVPASILHALEGQDNSELLPPEGHCVIPVSVKVTGFDSTTGECHVEVRLTAYRHSSRGQAIIQKLRSTLQGEVCRTNRYWRRKLQREQQHQEHQQKQEEDEPMTNS